MKQIVVITGSPRKGGNSDRMANAFIKGAGSQGNKLVKIAAADMNIHGCRACDACYSTGTPCVFHDDFNQIAGAIGEADVIVLATPMYWFSFSAQIKALIDRWYSLNRSEKGLKGEKQCVLLACGADDREHFEGLERTYEIMAEYLDWEDAGRVIAPGVCAVGDIENTDALEMAEILGRKIGMSRSEGQK